MRKSRLQKSWESSFEGFGELFESPSRAGQTYDTIKDGASSSDDQFEDLLSRKINQDGKCSDIVPHQPDHSSAILKHASNEHDSQFLASPLCSDQTGCVVKQGSSQLDMSSKTNDNASQKRKLSFLPESPFYNRSKLSSSNSTPGSASSISKFISEVLFTETPSQYHKQLPDEVCVDLYRRQANLSCTRSGKDECLSGVGIGVGGGGGALPVSPVKLPSTHQPTQATKVIFERNSNICSSHKGTVSSIMQGHDAYTPTANSQYITISIASMASQTIEENQSAESQEETISDGNIVSQTETCSEILSIEMDLPCEASVDLTPANCITEQHKVSTASVTDLISTVHSPVIIDKLSIVTRRKDKKQGLDCDPIKSRNMTVGGLADRLLKIMQREESHYNICRHQVTRLDDNSDIQLQCPSEIVSLRVVITDEQQYSEDGMEHCLVINDCGERLPAGTALRLEASRLKGQEKRSPFQLGDEIVIFWPWRLMECSYLGLCVITSSYCKAVSTTESHTVDYEPTSVIIGLLNNDGADSLLYPGTHTFLQQ